MGMVSKDRNGPGRRGFLRRVAAALAVALLLGPLATAPVRADAAPVRAWLIAYEVVPMSRKDMPGLSRASYEDKARVTQEAAERLVPKAMRTFGAALRLEWTRVGPGGYAGEINPSIYSSISATQAQAEKVAAALGYILHQSAVLVADLQDPKGKIAMVEISFRDAGLTPLRAAGFLRAANLTLTSNDLGFSSLDDRMIFLNLGTGIDDEAFHAGLAKTATTFPPPPAVSQLKRATAIFVTNNWARAPDGEEYAARLGGEMSNEVLNLRQLRGEYRALMSRAAKKYGWN